MLLRRKAISPLNDDALVALVRRGDRDALGHVWDRYAHLLFGVGMKYLKDAGRSKDVVVELFADLPALLLRHQVERFRPWVHTVMRNRCLLALRSTTRTRELAQEHLADSADEGAGEALLREASLKQLEQAMLQLNEAQATCIRLFHLERLSYAEVAQRTTWSIEQVRSHLQNGRRNLRHILQRHAA